jgi:hypothetical protein
MSKGITLLAAFGIAVFGWAATTRADDDEYSKKDIERMIERAEEKCGALKKVAAEELADSILAGTRIEAKINRELKDLDAAIDALNKKFDRDDEIEESRDEAKDVLTAGKRVNQALDDIKRDSATWEEWMPLWKEIRKLAEAYEQSED